MGHIMSVYFVNFIESLTAGTFGGGGVLQAIGFTI